jgi:4-hydroxybenzoate polyprenyltransferase/phosphoserine phosphatase
MRETAPRPLVVDLDGTLVATDLLWESLFVSLAARPSSALRLPFDLAAGKARFKERVASRGPVAVEDLPYRQDVLDLVKRRRAEGARTVLATAGDVSIARRVADHLGLFDDVVASDGCRNCKGSAKAEAIRELLGDVPYDYVGDSLADLPLVDSSSRVWLVDPPARLRRRADRAGKLESVLSRGGSRIGPMVRLVRPHQWAKNALILVPLLAAHEIGNPLLLPRALLAIVAFSLGASGLYVVNDLLDLPSDRRHPRKRARPLAAGSVAIPHAILLAATLFAASGGLALGLLGWNFAAVLLGYLVLSFAYSVWLKRKVFVDVLVLASLYSFRILAGGVATSLPISKWLVGFSMFFFLCLALAKRYCELDRLVHGQTANPRRGYRIEDLPLLRTLGPVAGFQAVMVLAFYVSSEATLAYPRREVLWLVCPVLLYWITRIWFLAHRREMEDDPVVFAMRDGRSLVAGLVTAAIVAAASLP